MIWLKSPACRGSRDASRRRRRKEVWKERTVVAAATKETFPFFSDVARRSTRGRHECQPYQITWPGGERGHRPQCLICGLAFFSLSLLSVRRLKGLFGILLYFIFFAVFELVASAFPRAPAPSCAARFDLRVLRSQRDTSVHLKSSMSQQRHSMYLMETEANSLYICVNTKGVAVYI